MADGRQDTAAVFTTEGRRRLPFIGGIDVGLAHQLPGQPAAGACPSQPLSPSGLKLGRPSQGQMFPFNKLAGGDFLV